MCIISRVIVSFYYHRCTPPALRVAEVGLVDHFHVHIVNANYQGAMLGMSVGQAHLFDDIISLVSFEILLNSCEEF